MREHLPALLAEIAEIAGIDAALAIAEAKGGIQGRITSQLRPGNWLVKCVGMEKAKLISAHFLAGRGRIDLDIPLGPTGSVKADIRRRAIAYQKALADGHTVFKTARMIGVTRRSVQRFKARMNERDEDQGDLF